MAIIKLDELHNLDIPLRTKDSLTIGSTHIDLLIPNRLELKSNQSLNITVDFTIELPMGEYGIIQPIHSLSTKYDLLIKSNTLHPGYTGRPTLVISNKGDNTLELKRGEHIAQLIIVQAGLITLA